jgi:hypothetical protein
LLLLGFYHQLRGGFGGVTVPGLVLVKLFDFDRDWTDATAAFLEIALRVERVFAATADFFAMLFFLVCLTCLERVD